MEEGGDREARCCGQRTSSARCAVLELTRCEANTAPHRTTPHRPVRLSAAYPCPALCVTALPLPRPTPSRHRSPGVISAAAEGATGYASPHPSEAPSFCPPLLDPPGHPTPWDAAAGVRKREIGFQPARSTESAQHRPAELSYLPSTATRPSLAGFLQEWRRGACRHPYIPIPPPVPSQCSTPLSSKS